MYNPDELRDTHGRWVTLGAQKVAFMVRKALGQQSIHPSDQSQRGSSIDRHMRRIMAQVGRNKEFHVKVEARPGEALQMRIHPRGSNRHVHITFHKHFAATVKVERTAPAPHRIVSRTGFLPNADRARTPGQATRDRGIGRQSAW